jgi:Domain of unknown function (DUF4922)
MVENNTLDYAELASEMLRLQKSEWKQLADNYSSLKNIKVREFKYDGFELRIQFNSERKASIAAKIDEESIKKRACFLCEENRPKEQREINYNKNFILLCNPFPVFPEHFTFTFKRHSNQEISGNFDTFLDISKDLAKKYTVMYNGPRAGASAPDHAHFQVGTKYYMPIDNEFPLLKSRYGEILKDTGNLTVTGINDGIRKYIAIESTSKDPIKKAFQHFYSVYEKIADEKEEPRMNIIGLYEKESSWRIIIFLRSKHRSSHYFAKEEKRILISPATVDMGGVCVTFLEEDFNKVDKDILAEIIGEVSIGKKEFDNFKSVFAQELHKL